MERNVRLTIAYDGTDFCGWQTQPGLRTAQETLEQVACRVVRHPVHLIAASRTDSGVHALGQVANFATSSDMPAEKIQRAVACRLPPDLTVVHARDVPADFHATRQAQGKLYRYTLLNTWRRPVEDLAQRRAWHWRSPLDIEAMRVAGGHLVGRHDFSGFANKGQPRQSPVREIRRVTIRRHCDYIYVDVEGDGFLYNQVRIIAGTLLEIGRGHWPASRVEEILSSGDRSLAGTTAPAAGLCLRWVRYPPIGRAEHGID